MTTTPTPRLSCIMVAGACRSRVQHALNRLCAQTVLPSLEIIVVDVSSPGSTPLTFPEHAPVTLLPAPGLNNWGQARRLGLERSSAPVVAFTEEHCFADPGWAAALIEAHQGPWSSVGYAFRNANRDSYVSRSAMITDYGKWLDPIPRGPISWLPGNNVSYKREALLSLGPQLDNALASDFIAHEIFRRRGLKMFVEPAALAHHLNFTTVWETALTNYYWCRAMAASRAKAGQWSRPRLILQALVTPAAAPVLRLARLTVQLRHRRPLWRPFLAAIPVFLPVSLCGGIGEAAGYLLGAGHAEFQLKRWELDVERVPVP